MKLKSLYCIICVIFEGVIFLYSYELIQNRYVSSIAIYRNRAFLTLPRSSCYNNLSDPTIVEAHFGLDYQNFRIARKVFPFLVKNQTKCDGLQDAIYTQVESKFARLWVLDKGTDKCYSKIVIYGLTQNTEEYKYNFKGIASKFLLTFALDYSKEFSPLAYIASASENDLAVFSFLKRKLWIVKLAFEGYPLNINKLALSQTSSELFLTHDEMTELYSVDLMDIRYFGNNLSENTVPVKLIGNKLGVSGGIVADVAGGLNYYLTRDYAVVRWIISEPLKAENHEVLLQSYETLPYVSQLCVNHQGDVLALVTPTPYKDCLKNNGHVLVNTQNSSMKILKVLKIAKKGKRKQFFNRSE